MLSALVLSFALINATNNLGSTDNYVYSMNLFYQSTWSQIGGDSSYIYDLHNNFNITCYLEFNSASDYKISVTSIELDSYVYTYRYDNTLVSTDHYDSYFNGTVLLNNGSSIGDFRLEPSYSFGDFNYLLSYNNSSLSRFYIPSFTVDIDRLNPITFNGQTFMRDVYLNMNTILVSTKYANGFNDGYNSGYDSGYSDGSVIGQQIGFTEGYNEGASQDATAVAIFSGIISVALIPINFFLACLNFEVFGINIGAFVSALLTIAIVVIITRMIMNGGNGGDK